MKGKKKKKHTHKKGQVGPDIDGVFDAVLKGLVDDY